MRGNEAHRAPARLVVASAAVTLSLLGVRAASGATVYWDPVSPETTPALGGSGTWSAGDNHWRTALSGGAQSTWANGDSATFGEISGIATYVVTLGSNISAGRITFTSDRYTIDGAYSLTAPIIQTNVNATVAATLAGSAGLEKYGLKDLTLTAANTFTGPTHLFGGVLRISTGTGGGNLGYTSGIAAEVAATLNVANATDTSISAPITGDGRIAKSGAGILSLSGANTYAGGTTVSDGTLRVTSNAAFGASSGTLTLGDTLTKGTLSYEGASTTMNRAITLNAGGGEIRATASGTTLTLGGAVSGTGRLTIGGAGKVTVSSAMSQAGGLTKNDAGALTISGANTYTGSTLVNQGTLLVNGSLSSGSALTLASGATLGGSGTVAGSLTAHGTLSPGVATGAIATLTTGPATWSADGSYTVDITSAGNTDLLVMSDLTQLAGFTISANSTDTLDGLTTPGTYTWEIARIGNAATTFNIAALNLSFGPNLAAYSADLSLTDEVNTGGTHSLMLNYVVIPEPTALLAAGFLAIPLLLRRRRNGARRVM